MEDSLKAREALMHFLSEFAMFQKPRKGHISRHCVTTEEQARRVRAAGAGSEGEDRPRVPDSPPWEAQLRPFSRPPAFPREVQVHSKTAPAGRQRHGGASMRQTAARTDLSSATCGTRHACGWHHGSGVKRDDFRRHLDTGSVRVTPTTWFRSAFLFLFLFILSFCLFQGPTRGIWRFPATAQMQTPVISPAGEQTTKTHF